MVLSEPRLRRCSTMGRAETRRNVRPPTPLPFLRQQKGDASEAKRDSQGVHTPTATAGLKPPYSPLDIKGEGRLHPSPFCVSKRGTAESERDLTQGVHDAHDAAPLYSPWASRGGSGHSLGRGGIGVSAPCAARTDDESRSLDERSIRFCSQKGSGKSAFAGLSDDSQSVRRRAGG